MTFNVFVKWRFKKNVKSHRNVSSLLNVYINFGLKTPACYRYLEAFITHSSQLHSFLCPHFWAWPWLTVIDFGNWLIKGCMTKRLRFLTFFCVFWKSKKHDFLRFLRCCTRFLEHWLQGIPSRYVHLLWCYTYRVGYRVRVCHLQQNINSSWQQPTGTRNPEIIVLSTDQVPVPLPSTPTLLRGFMFCCKRLR